MGLSIMEDLPGADQAMKFANIAGHATYITPAQWTGEHQIGMGMGEGPSDVIRSVGDAGAQIATAIGQLRKNKQRGGNPQGRLPASLPPANLQQSLGSPDMTKWLIYAGVALGAILILVMLMKKKKDEPKGFNS